MIQRRWKNLVTKATSRAEGNTPEDKKPPNRSAAINLHRNVFALKKKSRISEGFRGAILEETNRPTDQLTDWPNGNNVFRRSPAISFSRSPAWWRLSVDLTKAHL